MTIIGNRTTWTDDLNPNNFAAGVGAKSAPFPKMYLEKESFFGSNMGLESPLAGPVTSQSMGIKQSDIRSAIPITFPKLGHTANHSYLEARNVLLTGALLLMITSQVLVWGVETAANRQRRKYYKEIDDILKTLEPGESKTDGTRTVYKL